MVSMMRVVEHVVLFKAREGASKAALEACVLRFRALRELEGVVHLYAGAARSCLPQQGVWTHVLYGRYRDKEALHHYAQHPSHLQAVALADPLFQDKMALDWEASAPAIDFAKPFFAAAAAHVAFVQWTHPPHSPELVLALSQSLAASLSCHHHTSGPNFAPARARGFHWGFIARSDACAAPQMDAFAEILARDSSIEKFLCIDFGTDEVISSRM